MPARPPIREIVAKPTRGPQERDLLGGPEGRWTTGVLRAARSGCGLRGPGRPDVLIHAARWVLRLRSRADADRTGAVFYAARRPRRFSCRRTGLFGGRLSSRQIANTAAPIDSVAG